MYTLFLKVCPISWSFVLTAVMLPGGQTGNVSITPRNYMN